jgi:carbamate kinase
VVTQTIVEVNDPAFAAPAKFIGPVYTERRAHNLAEQNGWTIARDGATWRRVIASPRPRRIVEGATVLALLDLGRSSSAAAGAACRSSSAAASSSVSRQWWTRISPPR